jgi:hypothetical protein
VASPVSSRRGDGLQTNPYQSSCLQILEALAPGFIREQRVTNRADEGLLEALVSNGSSPRARSPGFDIPGGVYQRASGRVTLTSSEGAFHRSAYAIRALAARGATGTKGAALRSVAAANALTPLNPIRTRS